MKCKCGTENPAGAKFCNECGSKLEDTKTCPKPECGKSGLPSFAKFCPDCGSELEQDRIAAEKAEEERIATIAAKKAEQDRIAAEKAEKAEKAEQARISTTVQIGNLLVSDRNLGAPKGGAALNYTNDEDHSDHKNRSFKGRYYTWDEALTACPRGWRLPTKEEFEVISAAMQFSGDKAYLEDSSGNRCYFPLSGSDYDPSYVDGTYWSRTEDSSDAAWSLYVNASYSHVDYIDKFHGFSIRCVKTAD